MNYEKSVNYLRYIVFLLLGGLIGIGVPRSDLAPQKTTESKKSYRDLSVFSPDGKKYYIETEIPAFNPDERRARVGAVEQTLRVVSLFEQSNPQLRVVNWQPLVINSGKVRITGVFLDCEPNK